MQRSRVLSIVEGTWGRGTIYTDEPEPEHVEPEPEIEHFESPAVANGENVNEEASVESSQSHSANDDDIYTLPYFQSSLFATVLEDTITELRILVECNTEMRVSKLRSDMGLLLALKFGVKQPEVTDELDGIDASKLECNEYKLNKLDADRKYLSYVLMNTYMDLSLSKSFKALAQHVKDTVDRDNYRADLMEVEAKNRALRKELNRQLRQQRNHIKSVTYDTDVMIDELRTQVEDASLNAEIRSRYVDNWQRARTEQHLQTIYDKEYGPSTLIEYFKQRTDYEQRVHTEVELLINIAINETLEKVEEWMNKYDKDMEAIDLKVQIKKNDYQNMYDKRVGLEDTIAKHDQLMKAWLHFKDEREKARQYREKMNKSAITVQAWWRGLLVRRQLGPYKVSKKKSAKKEKK